jgi:hypothetical protein
MFEAVVWTIGPWLVTAAILYVAGMFFGGVSGSKVLTFSLVFAAIGAVIGFRKLFGNIQYDWRKHETRSQVAAFVRAVFLNILLIISIIAAFAAIGFLSRRFLS